MTGYADSPTRRPHLAQLLNHVVDSTDDAILTTAPDGTITSWNAGAERLFGYRAHEAMGRSSELLLPAEGGGETGHLLRSVFAGASVDRLETDWLRKDGVAVRVSLTMSPIQDPEGRIAAAALTARDLTERRHYQERLHHLANYDQLTGLYNRRRFEEEVNHQLAGAEKYQAAGALLIVDLDNFKAINDSAGHAAGDAVLTAVARELTRGFDSGDIVARLGGDEFAVLLPAAGSADARLAAEDLLAAIHSCRPSFAGRSFGVTASIGVTTFESDDATADEVVVNANLAMYAAKAAGRDRVIVYTASEGRRARDTAKSTWAERIRGALDRDGGFVLHRQPILDLATDEISHGELLLRMRDEYGNLIAPGAFLPAAERYGLIHAIDHWVVHQAIHTIAVARGDRPLPVSVNLSGDSVGGDPHLFETIERELADAVVDPEMLIFEVTETAAIANMPEATSFARRLNELGSSLALDDFGTGFGSFYYLKHLPVQYVKLDGEFIQNLPRSAVDAHMVNAIVGIAQGLGIKTVAESVTDEETVRLLREHGVDYAQGIYVGRPTPI